MISRRSCGSRKYYYNNNRCCTDIETQIGKYSIL